MLIIHVLGAVLTVVLMLLSLSALYRGSVKLARWRAALIGAAIFQIGTGLLLVISAPAVSWTRFCVASLVYLLAVVLAERLLRRAIITQGPVGQL